MADQALTVREQSAEVSRFMPVMSMDIAVQRRGMIVEAVKRLMVGPTKDEPAGVDYGVIPGTKKPTLYQPGADKLNNLFGLIPEFESITKIEDWTGRDHGGEPFFYYQERCRLMRDGFKMGEGSGSCNSWESKYRYRKSERVCPKCGKENIRKSKDKPDGTGGGWYCWTKTGGCGATFKDGDQSIEGQETGNKPNPDIFDLANTFLKMAQKRAKIAATLNATSAHEFFTQDVEDIPSLFPTSAAAVRVPEESDAPGSRGATHAEPPPIETPKLTEPPEPIKTLWSRMVDFASTVKVFQDLKKDIEEAVGSDRPYYEILATRGMKHANDMKGKPRSDVRMTVVALVEYLQKCKQEPPAEAM